MDQKVVLGYWAIRGLAQPIRFFLEYLEIPYEEKAYTDPNEWFGKDNQTFGGHPFTNLPYLKDGNTAVFESDAIYYYLAHRAGKAQLLGKDAQQQTQVATIRGVINDMRSNFLDWVYGGNKEEEQKQKAIKAADEYLFGFNYVLERSTFLAGETITYVDFLFWEYVDEFLVFHPELITKRPKLVEFHTKISEIPQIKKYLESPNYIKRPFNSPAHAIFY